MNKKTYFARKKSKEYLDHQFNTKEGVIKLNKNNTLQHELAKFLLAWEMLQNDQSRHLQPGRRDSIRSIAQRNRKVF